MALKSTTAFLLFFVSSFFANIATGYDAEEVRDLVCSTENSNFCELMTQELEAVEKLKTNHLQDNKRAILNKYLSSFLRRKLSRVKRMLQFDDSDFMEQVLRFYKIRHVITVGTSQRGLFLSYLM